MTDFRMNHVSEINRRGPFGQGFNIASGKGSTIGGGGGYIDWGIGPLIMTNSVTASLGTIGGGGSNLVADLFGTISGGYDNVIEGEFSTIGGGGYNLITAGGATIGGGGGLVLAGR